MNDRTAHETEDWVEIDLARIREIRGDPGYVPSGGDAFYNEKTKTPTFWIFNGERWKVIPLP